MVPEVPETRKKQHPLSLKSKRIKKEPSQVADNSHLKDKLEKLCKPVNLAASEKDLQGRPEKQNLVVNQEKLDVGYDQALLATKYQVDQITIRFQPAGLGSDTP